jgi:thiosulfate reductase cytochrome b subunit
VQRLLYLGVILAGVVIVLSGLSIWKPVQFQISHSLFGGYDAARYVHFFAMSSIVAFLAIHVRSRSGAEEPARHDLRPLRTETRCQTAQKSCPASIRSS